MRYSPGALAYPSGRQGLPRRCRRGSRRRPQPSRHDGGRDACRTRRRLPGSAETQRRRRGRGCAHFCRSLQHLQFGGVDGTRVRPLGSRRQLQIRGDGSRIRRIGCCTAGRVWCGPRRRRDGGTFGGSARPCVHRRASARQPSAQRQDSQRSVAAGFRAVAEAAAVPRCRRQARAWASGSGPPPRLMPR